MTYDELKKILTPDGIALPVKLRENVGNGDLSTARASIGGHSLRVSAHHDPDGFISKERKYVYVSCDSHFQRSDVEVVIHPMTETGEGITPLPEFATLRFSSAKRFDGSVMDGVRHDSEVRVVEETTVFVGLSDLLDLRTEINREIRKARRNNINVPKGA